MREMQGECSEKTRMEINKVVEQLWDSRRIIGTRAAIAVAKRWSRTRW